MRAQASLSDQSEALILLLGPFVMQLLESKQLYNYWDELRGKRIAPRRLDIEPSKISGLLGKIFILEQATAYSFRFRIAGSQMCSAFGIDFVDTDFLSCFSLNDRLTFVRQLSLLTENGAVLVANITASPENERSVRLPFEFILLPVQNSCGTIDRVLGVASCSLAGEQVCDGAPELAPLTFWRLNKIDTLWCEHESCREVEFANGDRTADVFNVKPLGGTRQGRIVDRNRRRFRVYDGGISGPSKGEG